MVKKIPDIQCFTECPGFDVVCLNKHVLDVAYKTFRQTYGEIGTSDNE